jgi:hypothetical protein
MDRKRRAILAGAFVLLAFGVLYNVRAAHVIAERGGFSLTEAVDLWWRGFEPAHSYPGILLLAVDRIDTALLILTVLIISAAWASAGLTAASRSRDRERS